jgi:hypothetical protein
VVLINYASAWLFNLGILLFRSGGIKAWFGFPREFNVPKKWIVTKILVATSPFKYKITVVFKQFSQLSVFCATREGSCLQRQSTASECS